MSSADERVKSMTGSYLNLIEQIGEDVAREGLLKTPERAANAMLFFTKGYGETLQGYILFFLYNFQGKIYSGLILRYSIQEKVVSI